MQLRNGYLGTYDSPQSAGIYHFQFDPDTGILSEPKLYYAAPDSKYLSYSHGLLASPLKRDGRAGVCLIDASGSSPRLIGELYEETGSACYVVQDDAFVYTANYHTGNILIYRKGDKGLTLHKRLNAGENAGCHQILFHGRYMMVVCLLLDRILYFDIENDFADAGSLNFPGGTGPRHGIFDRTHKYFYLVSELTNELFLYEAGDGPHFTLKSTTRILPEGRVWNPAAISAAIRLSPDEHFLYVSTRYADLITVYRIDNGKLVQIQQTGCGGSYPRDFIITEDGGYLLVVNRYEGGLVSFRLDPNTGKLSTLCSRVPAPEAVAVVLEEYFPERSINL